MAKPKVRNDDELEKLTEELMLQLIKKCMQVKNDLVRSDGMSHPGHGFTMPGLIHWLVQSFKSFKVVRSKRVTSFISSPWPMQFTNNMLQGKSNRT